MDENGVDEPGKMLTLQVVSQRPTSLAAVHVYMPPSLSVTPAMASSIAPSWSNVMTILLLGRRRMLFLCLKKVIITHEIMTGHIDVD